VSPGFADNVAVAFQSQLMQAFAPLGALGAIIHDNPDFKRLHPRFDAIAKELLEQVGRRGMGIRRGCEIKVVAAACQLLWLYSALLW
jgi:hypothetical protein